MPSGIANLLSLTNDIPTYRELVKYLAKQRNSMQVVVLDAARSYVIASLYNSLKRPLLTVTAHSEEGKKIHETLTTWTRGLTQPMLFPEPDNLPYQNVVSDTTTEMERIRVLSTLSARADNGYPPLVVTSVPAVMQKVTPYRDFSTSCHRIRVGNSIAPLDLIRQWQKIGYRLEHTVELPGSISRRGGIIDIYSPSNEMPTRVEFTGDIIESIRLFDPASQRSLDQVQDIAIAPATELISPLLNSKEEIARIIGSISRNSHPVIQGTQMGKGLAELLNGEVTDDSTFFAPFFNWDSFLSYLPQNTLLILLEPRRLALSAADFDTRAGGIRSERTARDELPPGFPTPYFKWGEVEARMDQKQCLHFIAWEEPDSNKSLSLEFKPAPVFSGRIPTFTEETARLKQEGHRIIVVSHQANRLSEILSEAGIIAPPLNEIRDIPSHGSITLVQGLLPQGWTMNGHNHIFTDYELFGFTKERRLSKQRPVSSRTQLNDLNPGDYVVHIEHGIALFNGVTRMESYGTEREYLVLEYASGDRLYVPTDQIHRISRYVGSGENPPSPSRLGTPEWSRTKQKARRAAEEVAEELVSLYAARGVVDGFSFSADNVWQQEFESSFPYMETPDQNRVQQQVKDDMKRPKPMDRLICGDVGYGKTEIAIRAAFKAVMDGKQVAVLVPTTVLAQQHYSTFNQRLSAFPVRIEVLSRFKNPKQQRTVLEELARGSVDICIGTHRLLQKDVFFRDLGLLIIDEEQRFGVKHKEFLKQMRKEVDVLTLSATPIPRTLHMSLVGVRDMSTIETPPEDRLPIKTFVAEYNESLIREAVLRELERNGQVFFVHNRVQSIAVVAQRIQELVPEARTAVAHGQMSEDELEMVMTEFARGEIDILICTTIIESGL
ncbi:MAG: CarD family transcriptional regulator, partial [Dehalococcoidales bacterium]